MLFSEIHELKAKLANIEDGNRHSPERYPKESLAVARSHSNTISGSTIEDPTVELFVSRLRRLVTHQKLVNFLSVPQPESPSISQALAEDEESSLSPQYEYVSLNTDNPGEKT